MLVTGLHAQVAGLQDMCTEPEPPVPVDGTTVTADQLRAAMTHVRDFIAQSDVYQSCLLGEVEAAKTQASANSLPFEPMIETSAKLKIANSQKAKEKAGLSINNALTAFKQAHPN